MPGPTDNYVGNLGTGGETYASDSVGSVHTPRVKVTWGVDGTVVDASEASPLPTRIGSGSVNAGIEPFGSLQVNNGFQTLFYDAWPTNPIDTTDKWTVTGTTPVVANGNMTMVATLSTYNAIRTKDTIIPNVGFTIVRNGIQLEAAAATGCGRFWGLGTTATTPAPAVLAQNGIGFEIDQAAGTLLAVTYAAGVRTTVATLTRPADGATHAYGMYFRVTQAYWLIDGVTVASQSFPNIQVAELPALIVRQNAAAFVGTPAFVNIAHLTADTARQGILLSDPVIGTRMARVKAASTAAVAADTALVVALHPSSPMPTAAAPATYSASITGLVAATLATDVFTIYGSATKTIRITGILVSGVQTTASQANVLAIKRSALNTGGTSTAPTRVPYDSQSAAATATVLAYTANPSALGAAVGTLSTRRLFVPGAATASDAQGLEIKFGEAQQQMVTLRGAAEGLAINLNGVTLAGNSFNITIEWTES